MSTPSHRWAGRGSKLINRAAGRRRDRAARRLLGEPLEKRLLLAADLELNPYHNYSFNVDVDQNWVVSPRDALLVLRSMETLGMGPLNGGNGEGESTTGQSAANKFDTNNDGNLAPSDFLRVVNFLNSGEGAPGDLVEFTLLPLSLQGLPLPNNEVQKGEDFVLAAFVQDIRTTPTGVFSAYLDVAYTNPDIHSVVISETQRITLPSQRNDNGTPDVPDDDTFEPLGGTFQLTYNGQTTGNIDVTGLTDLQVGGKIASALDQLSGIGFPGISQQRTSTSNAESATPVNPNNDIIEIANFSGLPRRDFRIQIGNELMWVTEFRTTSPVFPGAPDPPDQLFVMRGHAGTTVQAHPAGSPVSLVEGNIEVKRTDQFDPQTQLVTNPKNYEIKFVNDLFEQDVPPICLPGGTVDMDETCTATADDLVTTLPKTVIVEEIAKGVATDPEAFRRAFVASAVYPNGQNAEDGDVDAQGMLVDPNVYSEVGSFADSISPLGGGLFLLWTVRINADAAGTITFQGNPAEDQELRAIQVYGQETAIPTSMVEYGQPVTVTIVEDVTAADDQFIGANSVDEDSDNNPLNVLANDSAQTGSLVITGVSNISNGGSVQIVNNGTSLSYSPADNFFGTETFEYTVSNGLGSTSSAMVTVNVFEINDVPVAENDTKSTQESTQLVFDLSDLIANDVVGPATPAPNETTTQSFTAFQFAAGSLGGTISIDDQGTATLADDVVTYTPPTGVTGTETFTYTITDNGTSRGAADPRSGTAVLSVTISEVNDQPIARDDAVDGTEDTVRTITAASLLSNDEAGDANQTISVTGVSAMSANGGTVSLSGTTITYTPPDDYFGDDTFTYTITDTGVPPLSATATVTVSLAPVNDPPEAVDDLNVSVDELSQAADNPIYVLANDTPGPMEESIDSISIVSFTQGANGTVALDDNGTPSDPSDDFLTYQPNVDFVDGSDSFTYTIEDGANLPATATVTVDVVPALRPRARNDNPASVAEGSSLTIDVLANDLPNVGEEVTLLSFGNGAFGTVSRNDNGTAGDLTDDRLVYTPNDPNFVGSDSFTYTINDTAGTGDDSTATVTVRFTAVNDQPTVQVPGSQTTDEDDVLTISGISVDDVDQDFAASSFNLRVSLSVADGDLTLGTTTGLSFTAGGNGQSSMTFNGTIAALNAALASIEYAPDPDFNGSDTLNVTVNDMGNVGGGDLSATGSVAITVNPVNDAPVLAVPGSQQTVRDTDLVFSTANGNRISVSDVDSNPDDIELSLSVNNGTLHLATTSGLTFTAGSNGSASFTVEGTQAELNAALNGLIYRPTAAFSGNSTLNVNVDDLGNNGSGEAESDSGSVPIAIQNFINSDLSGYAYVDEDFDRTVDSGELMLAGITVQLSGTSILNQPVLMTTTTNAGGYYEFQDVPPGQYQIQLGDVAYMVDAGETPGLQGGYADDTHDRIHGIVLNQFGVGEDGGIGNNFGKWGLQAQYLTIAELFASSTDEGLLFATDTAGNQFWHSVLTGWDGVTSASATLSQDLREVTIRIETQQNGTQTQTYSIRDSRVRLGLDGNGGAVIRLDGTAAELGFTLAAREGGEGEGPARDAAATPDVCVPEQAEAEQYAAAVDRLLAEAQWS